MRKSWYFNTVGTVVAVLAVLPSSPIWAEPLTEAQAVAAALARAPELLAVQRQGAVARRAAGLAVALPQPMVRVTISQIGIPPMEPPAAWAMVEQPILIGNQQLAQRGLAAAIASVNDTDAQVVAGEIAYWVRSSFARWRGLHRRLDLLAHHVNMAQGIEKTLVAAMAAGQQVSVSRLAQAQADSAQLYGQRAAVAAALPGAQLELAAWTGNPTPEAPTLEMPAQPTPETLHRHPALAKLDAQNGVLTARGAAERAAAGWTVTPSAGVMTMPGMAFGLMFSVGLRPGAWTQAEAQRQAGLAATSDDAIAVQAQAAQGLQRRLKAKIAAADGELAQLQVRLHSLKSAVLPAQRRAVTAAMPALAAGARSVADLLEAQHRLVAVELQIVDLETQWLLQRAARLRLNTNEADAMGGMSGGSNPIGGGMTGMGEMDDGDAGMPMSRGSQMR